MSEEDVTPSNEHADTQDAPASEAQRTPLEAELAAARAERDKLKDQLLRTAADFDNYRKRARKDVEDARARTREDVVREVLSVVDNLERAEQAAAHATDLSAVVEGVRMVLKSFEDVASRIGIERVVALGERFDPTLHDAVQQVESADHAPGTVVTEVLAGYRLGDRLVRPALVVVAKAVSN